MKEVRVQLTPNVLAKSPKATKLKKIKPTYEALVGFASATFKFNKKKTRLFVRKFGHQTAPGTEITKQSDVESILVDDIMIAVSKGEDYIGSSYKLNEKELNKYQKAPYHYLLEKLSFDKKDDIKPVINSKDPSQRLSYEKCQMIMTYGKVFPRLDGCVLNILKLIANKHEGIDVYYNSAGYYSFDYNTKIKYPPTNTWEACVLREFRGLIVSSVTGKVLARRFHKFFNIGELPETEMTNIDLKDYKMYHKIDGSLVSPILLDNNEIIWATRKVPIQVSDDCLTQNLVEFVGGCVTKNLTPLFEYCQTDKYVGIIQHTKNSLTLLAVRHNVTGEYMDLESLNTNGIDVVAKCEHNIFEIDRWINHEGVVIVMPNGLRYKVKSKWYKVVAQSNYYGGNDGFIEQYLKRYGSLNDCPKDNIWKHVLNEKIPNKIEVFKKTVDNLDSSTYQNFHKFLRRVEMSIDNLAQSLSKWYNTICNTVDDVSSIKTIIESNGWPCMIFKKQTSKGHNEDENKDNTENGKEDETGKVEVDRRELVTFLYQLVKHRNVNIVENILDTVWSNNQLIDMPYKTDITFPVDTRIEFNNNIKKHIVNTYLPAKILQLTGESNWSPGMTLTIPTGYKPDEGRINGLWEEFKKNNIWDLRIDLQPSTNGPYTEHYGNKRYALLLVQYGLENSKRVPSGSICGVLVPVDISYKLEEFKEAMTVALEYGGIVRMKRKMNMNTGFKIYCDLDGVLVDFVKGVTDLTHYPPEAQSDNKMWQRILSKDHFFETLEWMPTGKSLWNQIKTISGQTPTILTGLPRSSQNKVIKGKKKWCKDKLGDVEVITCMSKQKHEYSNKNHILIDDRLDLAENWRKQGGIFIHHYDIKKTLYELKKVFGKLPAKVKINKNPNPGSYKITRNVLSHETLVDNKMYKYDKQVTYGDLNEYCQKEIIFKNKPKIVAIDFEWNPYRSCRGVNLAQLTTKDMVYLFDMEIGKQSEFVYQILKDSEILKLGFGLDDDVKRLNCDIMNVIDVQSYVTENYENVWNTKNPSLDITGQLIINKTINKDKKITMSQWDLRPLNNQQIDYAAKDTSVLYDIYTQLVYNNDLEKDKNDNIRDMFSYNIYLKESNSAVFNFEYDLNKPIKVIYSGIFITIESIKELKTKYPPKHSNVKYDHITLKYEPDKRDVKKLNIGQHIHIDIIGQYTDSKLDVLLVKTIFGIGHITLSFANGVSPKEAKDIPIEKYERYVDLDTKMMWANGVIGLHVTYIKDDMMGLPDRIKDKIKNFESDALPGENIKFKPHELTATHRSIIHRYAETHFMNSQSSGKEQNRRLTLTMGRQKTKSDDIKIVGRKSNNYDGVTFRLKDIMLVNKANLVFPVEQYVGELEENSIKWNQQMDFNNTMVILRGLSGSGKSKLAEIIKEENNNTVIVSADNYFFNEAGEYKYDSQKLDDAHQFSYRTAKMCIRNLCKTIVIDNTNSTLKEYKNYIQLGESNDYKIIILEIECSNKTDAIIMGKRNTHHKNIKATLSMYSRWEMEEKALYIRPHWTGTQTAIDQSQVSLMKWLVDNKYITSIKSNMKTHMWMSVGGLGVKFINIPKDKMDEFYQIFYNSGITGNYTDENKYLAEMVDEKFRLYFDVDYEDEIPFTDIEELVEVVKEVTGTRDIYVTGNENVNDDVVKTGMHVHCYDVIVTLEECQEYIKKLVDALDANPLLNYVQWVKFIDDQAYHSIRMLGSRKVTKDVDKGNVYRVMYKTDDVEGIDLLKKVSCRI